jgi:hypothetical protein
MYTHTIAIPDKLYQQLQRQALVSQQSVDALAEQALNRVLPLMIEVEEELPPALQTELKAMERLSDGALWALASSQLTTQQQTELVHLAEVQEERPLNTAELVQQEALLTAYDELLLRRAHAAVLLQARGHDLTNLVHRPTP